MPSARKSTTATPPMATKIGPPRRVEINRTTSHGQAEVAAAGAVAPAGQADKIYNEIVPVTMLKVVGVDLTSIGVIQADGPNQSEIRLEDQEEHRYRKLILDGNIIIGAILLGYQTEAAGVAEAVRQGLDVSAQIDTFKGGDWRWFVSLME